MSENQQQSDAPLPRHIGIIMDGNGRWARGRNLPRIAGHREGAKSVRDVVRACRKIGVKGLTLFAFSEQNWERPEEEVEALMELLHQYIREEHQEIMDNKIRLTTIGDTDRLPVIVRHALAALMEVSSQNDAMVLCLALSYSSQSDLVGAVRSIAEDVQRKGLTPTDITADLLSQRLATAKLPPLDLLVRTSGEYRLSDFLLWEAAFAELFFTPTMWPDFRREHLMEAISTYQARERRFGLTSDQLRKQQSS